MELILLSSMVPPQNELVFIFSPGRKTILLASRVLSWQPFVPLNANCEPLNKVQFQAAIIFCW